MNKKKSCFKYFRLTLAFAFIVFLIMLVTMCFVFFGTHILSRLNVVEGELNRFPLFLFCLGSVVIGTILAAVFSRAPLKPLRELMDAADKIAAGDYDVRINLKGTEDIKALSDKFNHMVEEIGSVEMLRTDFVNNISHEFKTPIVSIRGFAKALKRDDLSAKEREEYLDIIISESERLSELSANVLYLSKIEKQAILSDKKRFNLSEQIRLAIVLLDQKICEKNIEIIFDNDEYFINANEEMLKQVWINLLDNAVKFSPDGGRIEVRITEAEEDITVRISDEGKGISPEEKEHIFDKFYQGDLSHSTSGNGLGLSIVKKIVDLHSGNINIRSSDKGSTFAITIKKS